MTNTTDTYWDVDGVSLQTFAMNIQTLGGTRSSPAPFRGDDITIPGRPGQIWMPKEVDAKTVELAMWVRGANSDGTIPTLGSDQRDLYDDNLRTLQHLLHTPGRQFTLTKRFRIGGVLYSASALGEYAGGLEPSMIGRKASTFTVDIKITAGYFYNDVVTQMTLVNGDNNFNFITDGPSSNVVITIEGARHNVTIRNKTRGMQVQYPGTLNAGDQVVLDVADFISTTTPDGVAPFDSSVDILHSGAVEWLSIQNGLNVINLTSDSGAGTVILQARGAFH